jgi:hypothetical protein
MKLIRTSQIKLRSFRARRTPSVAVWWLFFFALLSRDALSEPTSTPKLTVDAAFTLERSVPSVDFSIKNVSSETVVIPETQLPWNTESTAILVVVSAQSGEPVRRAGIVRDRFGPPPLVSLPPGQSLKGVARLTAFFSDTGKPRRYDRYLLLFWYYKPEAADGRELGEYGGWFKFRADTN